MCYAGLGLPAQWWILYRGYENAALSQYQHQSTLVPSIGNVCIGLLYPWCRNMDRLGCRHKDTAGFPHEVSATDTWYTLVGSCLQYRGASAVWFVNHRWHLTSSTLISVWRCCTPGPWSTNTWRSASDGMDGRKPMAMLQLEKTMHRAALATSGSTRFRRMPTPYRYLRCGDLRSP